MKALSSDVFQCLVLLHVYVHMYMYMSKYAYNMFVYVCVCVDDYIFCCVNSPYLSHH